MQCPLVGYHWGPSATNVHKQHNTHALHISSLQPKRLPGDAYDAMRSKNLPDLLLDPHSRLDERFQNISTCHKHGLDGGIALPTPALYKRRERHVSQLLHTRIGCKVT